MYRLWRWLRFPLAVVAAVVVGVLVWVIWLLSGQRYQDVLTHQLSALLGADVQVASSELSFRKGLGIQLHTVTMQRGIDPTPFFTAARVDLLLDPRALLQGQLLFHYVNCFQPRVVLSEGRPLQVPPFAKQAARPEREQPPEPWFGRWFSPTLALAQVSLVDGEITYVSETRKASLVFVQTNAVLTQREEIILKVNAALGSAGDLGHLTLVASTPGWDTAPTFAQLLWQGRVQLQSVQVQPVGRMLGTKWPVMTLGLNGHYQGAWVGPVTLTGAVEIREAKVGAVQVREGKAKLTKLLWSGQGGTTGASPSLFRTTVFAGQIEQVRAEVGSTRVPLVLRTGEITLREEILSVAKITGTYGTQSRLVDGGGIFKRLAAASGPSLEAHVEADVDLQEARRLFPDSHVNPELLAVAQHVTEPRGRAVLRVTLQAPTLSGPLTYQGESTLRQAGFHASRWNADVSDLAGTIRFDNDMLTSERLTAKIGQSPLQIQGTVREYLSARRSAELHLTFTELHDQDLTPFLPTGLLLPQDGILRGQVNVLLPPGDGSVHTNGNVLLSRVSLNPLSFLRPIDVGEGQLTWQGQQGTFTVTRGSLPGGDFTGRGQFRSLVPLNIELTANFSTLDLEPSLALDKPSAAATEPKDRTTVVRADLSCDRCVYKTMTADNLRMSCHWHGRQADLVFTEAKVAGGGITGEAVLRPDLDALFLAPQVTQVGVRRFFSALGKSLDALSGSLSGSGKIYMPNWHTWDEPASWNAALNFTIVEGVAKQLPILVRLWSALSLQGLLSLELPSLPREGLAFSSLTGDLAIGEGMAVTSNLVLNSSAVRLEAQGAIDLVHGSVDLRTALVPLHGITSSVAKVPLAGELLARGADFLTTLSFRVTGPYADPTVTPLL